MKTCPRCHEEKPLSGFHRDKHTVSGYTSHCAACRRIARRRWLDRPEARAHWNEYQRERYAADVQRQRTRRHNQKRNNRPMARAHAAVTFAIKTGKLTPARDCACEQAGPDCVGEVQYHHDSYLPADKLMVRPLCASHHKRWHIANEVLQPD